MVAVPVERLRNVGHEMTATTPYDCVGKFIFCRRAWKRGSERRGSKGIHTLMIGSIASRSSAAF